MSFKLKIIMPTLLVILCACSSVHLETKNMNQEKQCMACTTDTCRKDNYCEARLSRAIQISNFENALLAGNLEVIKYYIEDAKIGINEILDHEYKNTPIFYAAVTRSPNASEIASYLIDRGANINQIGLGVTRTPLITAIWKNNNVVAKILIEKGADLNVRNDRGYDLCIHAHRYSDFEIMPYIPGCCDRIGQMNLDTEALNNKLRPPAFYASCTKPPVPDPKAQYMSVK